MLMKLRPSQARGVVRLSGAKNAALPLLAATILTDQEVRLDNCPVEMIDVKILLDFLRLLGKDISITGKTCVVGGSLKTSEVPPFGKSTRASLLVAGALLARTGRCCVPLPGGCRIGERKWDIHRDVLAAMGAKLEERGECLEGAVSRLPLRAVDVTLRLRSTGATENAILAGCLGQGVSRIRNPHLRPEVMNLVDLLRSMGALIEVHGQSLIEVEGRQELGGGHVVVISDNIEAVTWLVAASVSGGEITVENFPFGHLEVPITFLRHGGVGLFSDGSSTVIARAGNHYPLEISTGPYPGINSDMQPLLAVHCSQAAGDSKIIDLRFPGRYNYMKELSKLGVKYSLRDNVLVIHGPTRLVGGRVAATDLRGGAALFLAGLVASGETVIERAEEILRGYEDFVAKSRALGINIEMEK